MQTSIIHTPERSTRPAAAAPFTVVAAQPHHGPQVYDVIQWAHAQPLDAHKRAQFAQRFKRQLERFPEGQFVAVDHSGPGGRERVLGAAMSMRTARAPSEPPLSWAAMVGDHALPHHDPRGAWLYGVDMAVHPAQQGRGMGSALYAARFTLIQEGQLRGWYAGGMLMGYHRVAHWMTPLAYARAVVAGRLVDPTVSMQMRRGMRAHAILEGYDREPLAGDCAVLLSWMPDAASRRLHSACHATPPRPTHRAPFNV